MKKTVKKLGKSNLIRLIAIVIFLAVAVGATILLIPFIKSLATAEGRIGIQNWIEARGVWGPLAFLGLQVLQIVVAMIPGEPVQLLAGVLFGAWGGLGLCIAGLLIGTLLIFFAVRWVGKPLVDAFVSETWMSKLEFLKSEKKLETVVFILFLIPGIPKDVLTYFAPLTPIKPWKFLLLSTLGRLPALTVSTLAGEHIGQGNWLMTGIIFAVALMIGLAGIFLKDKVFNKNKTDGKEAKNSKEKN